MEAITREEKIMSGENLTPITREEMFLAKAAGKDVDVPTPITRREKFLSKISSDGGSGSCVDVQSISITENGTYTAPSGVAYSPIFVDVASSGGVNKLAQMVDRTLTEVTAVDLQGATKIASYAFYEYRSLISIEIPEGVTIIEQKAFSNCLGLKNIKIPEGLTRIEQEAFYYCSSLISIEIPESVTNIYPQAFRYCTGLENFKLLSETPPTISTNTFMNTVAAKLKFYVPASAVDTYKSATNWSTLADQIFAIEE